MSELQTISVALTAEQLHVLEAAVARGEYLSASDIVREALRDWQQRRELGCDDSGQLGRLWDEGKASGPSRPFDLQRTLSAARRRMTGSGAA